MMCPYHRTHTTRRTNVSQSTPPIKALLQRGDLVWIARETGYSYAYLWRVVNGLEPGRPSTRRAIARVLGKEESELFEVAPVA